MRTFLVIGTLAAAFAAVVLLSRGAPAPAVDAVLADEADGAGRPVVLEFSAAWCRACTQYERHVLPDADVQAALGQVRYVRYDIERGEGKAAAARYGVTSLPTIVTLDRDGRVTGGLRGLPSVASLLELLSARAPRVPDETAPTNAPAAGRDAPP